MSSDQQGMFGFPMNRNPYGEPIDQDHTPLRPPRITDSSWHGDYLPPPPNPQQSSWFSPNQAQGSSQLVQNSSINIPAPNPKPLIVNGCYDPMFEVMGLPLDPHLRVFLAKPNGVASDNGGGK